MNNGLINAKDNLYQVAETQAGYFTTQQAIKAGYSQRQLTYYVANGSFLRVRRGCYRLARFPHSPHEDLFVAWLETGPDSVISHESALVLYELSDVMPADIHVIIPRTASRRHRGLRLHTNRLEPEDVTRFAGLPVTIIPRTLAHVANSGLADELIIQAMQEAIRRGLVTQTTMLNFAETEGGRIRRLAHLAFTQKVDA
ncbi:MAG: type IV toxin-antitoxin system AbiEi family antitoxin domain-containing protein [Caldilineales bacterium]|nr:type IV toxin-antitoxin system AbiEi family antitoxin domain-containing protein [Caldilineales bacterium]